MASHSHMKPHEGTVVRRGNTERLKISYIYTVMATSSGPCWYFSALSPIAVVVLSKTTKINGGILRELLPHEYFTLT